MANYKILETRINEDVSTSILNKDTGIICPKCTGNKEYDQFIVDVVGIGTSCVEGPTVGVITAYSNSRSEEYPSIQDQLDKIYHGGVDAWKADIKAIKDKYPKTQVGVTTVAAVPSWVQTVVDEKIASDQKSSYLSAVERLKQRRLKLGIAYTEKVYNAEEFKYEESIKYKDVPDPNSTAVVNDEAERDAAQAVIDGTPQSIIDSINT